MEMKHFAGESCVVKSRKFNATFRSYFSLALLFFPAPVIRDGISRYPRFAVIIVIIRADIRAFTSGCRATRSFCQICDECKYVAFMRRILLHCHTQLGHCRRALATRRDGPPVPSRRRLFSARIVSPEAARCESESER